MKRIYSILLFLYSTSIVFSQVFLEKGYFRSPLDTTIRLAGNFGELRNNHFHAGLDIKTQNREGLKIYAVADGYVSRIKISPYGYGKALYITHPNGYVSVYAHLSSFNDSIARYLIREQYKQESFEVDLNISSNILSVKKGEVVAFSGNTGGSSGPHLHFEIREEKSEKAVNPLFFGFDVPDHVKPFLLQLVVNPLDKNSHVNGKDSPLHLKIAGSNRKYSVSPDTINASGNIGLAIDAYDSEDNSSHRNGVFSIELLKNDKRIYYHEMAKIGFDEMRYLNCFIDYPEKKKNGKNIQQSFLLKNNKLSIYKDVVNGGIISINKDSIYKLTYLAKDFCGNTSSLVFYIKGKPKTSLSKTSQPALPKCAAVFHCNELNEFKTNDISITLPENILYEDIQFTYSVTKTIPPWALTPIHSLHNGSIPIHTYYTLSIRTPLLPDSLLSKAVIISIDTSGRKTNEGGELKDGFITTQTRSFGNFTLVLDTLKPKIKPLNILNNKKITGQQTINFRVSDNLTDVKKYKGTIDGKWVLFEYEPKKSLLFYTIESSLSKGKHLLKMEIQDGKNNVSTYLATFYY